MIPKIIHQIWIGDKKIPSEYVDFSNRWKTMYPDFQYVLWDNKRSDFENLIGIDKLEYYNDDSYPIAFKADTLRYEIIKEYGGLYIDMDTEPLRRMDDDMFDLLFFAGFQQNGEVNNALFASEPNGELINNVLNWLIYHLNSCIKNNVPKTDVHRLTGPEYFNDICGHYCDTPKHKFFDCKYFYPYWFLEKSRRFENFKITSPETYSVHHWLHSWGIEK